MRGTTVTEADAGILEEDPRPDFEAILTVRYRIDELQIPAAQSVHRLRIGLVVLTSLVPIVVALVFLSSYTADLPDALEFLSQLSLLNIYVSQIAALPLRLIGERFGVFTEANDTRLFGPPPAALGGSWETGAQLRAALSAAARAIEDAAAFRGFTGADEARNNFFAGTIPYRYFTGPEQYTVNVIAVQSAFVETIVGAQGFAAVDAVLEPAVMNTSHVLNVVGNIGTIAPDIDITRGLVFDDMTESNVNVRMYVQIALGVGIPLILLISVVSLYLQVSWIAV
jgi:hypothetical protein